MRSVIQQADAGGAKGSPRSGAERQPSGARIVLSELIVALCTILLICPSAAHAYVDPGTGSYLYQLSIAGVFGAFYAVRVYWREVRTFVAHAFRRHSSET